MVAVGSVLTGRYRLEELVADGGMGSVFAAYDETLHRRVAVKVHRSGSTLDRRRFDREARVLAGLAHPNLVPVFDAGEEGDDLYVVLELIDGPTLAARISEGALDPAETRQVGEQLAAALAYVHGQGVVHRDVKPSNVMFDGRGRPRLGDFGIAHFADATALTETSMTVGTVAYMAPEQLDGTEVTGKADVYALGLVLLESLTGNRAFPGAAHEAALARLARDPDVPGDLPAPWPPLLRAMTTRRPEARAGAAYVAAALSELTGEASAPTVVATDPSPTAPALAPVATDRPVIRGPRRAALWLLVGAAVLVGALTLIASVDDNDVPTAPSTTAVPSTVPSTGTTATTVAPATAPPTQPAVDCAALEAEKDALEARQREISDLYRHDRETRERLRDEIDTRKREVDAQLREHCR